MLHMQDTSRAAYAQIEPVAENIREEVMAFIESRGSEGATDVEVEKALGIRAQTVTPRRNELMKDGRVVKSDRRRSTPSGRTAIVWVAAAYA